MKIVLAISLALPLVLGAPRPLAADVREEMNQGVVAANENKWALALQHFTKAQQLAPKTPEVVFNLGLAHSKAGNTLTAAILLNMYLALPGATGQYETRAEVSRLEAETESRIREVVEQARKLAQNFGHHTAGIYVKIASQQARGDPHGALRTFQMAVDLTSPEKLQNDVKIVTSKIWEEHSDHLAYCGDVQAFRAALRLIRDTEKGNIEQLDEWWKAAADSRVRRYGDEAGARDAAQNIANVTLRGYVDDAIAHYRGRHLTDFYLLGPDRRFEKVLAHEMDIETELSRVVKVHEPPWGDEIEAERLFGRKDAVFPERLARVVGYLSSELCCLKTWEKELASRQRTTLP